MTIDRWWAAWRLVRDVVLFGTGLGLIVYEAVFKAGTIDYGMLPVYAGMVGLPVFFRTDEKRHDQPEPES